MKIFKYSYKMLFAVGHDIIMGLVAFSVALALRYSLTEHVFFEFIPNLAEKYLFIVVLQFITFTSFGLYRGVWRFSSIHDLKQIIKASLLTTFLIGLVFYLTDNMANVPRSSIVMFFCLLVLSTGGGRFIYRILKEGQKTQADEWILIVGAGYAAEQLIRDIKSTSNQYQIAGLVDDNPSLLGRTIHGFRVLGDTSMLPKLAIRHKVSTIFMAIPSAAGSDIRRIIGVCAEIKNIEIKTLPSRKDIIDGKIRLSALRQVKLEDLLGRETIELDSASIGRMLTGKCILVTGAGGSIGSELANQVAKFEPSTLVLLDTNEFFLYEINRKIRSRFPEVNIVPVVADIRDEARVLEVLEKHTVDHIYHAAAYKHVPLMEENAGEAIKTNVQGTLILAQAAKQKNVKKFVVISSDKAVNPTSVMGATKRLAEMICQELSDESTSFTNVRFGNVLGSNGSVIPLFEEQIKNGGPVTITHRDIVRYFMVTAEAAQLVLQAGAMGRGGEIFVLNMGEPVKIYDLARKMISLSGLRPDEDIEIKEIGLRTGEKLYEELLVNEENTLPTPHPDLRVACVRPVCSDIIQKALKLVADSKDQDSDKVKLLLSEFLGEYKPQFNHEFQEMKLNTKNTAGL